MVPFREKVAGSTSDLHRDKNMGYESRKLIPAEESLFFNP